MLLIKCPQCNRSYRLAESLYRRKAAGYGVVITCRHCKTQIHVDEGDVPAGAAETSEASDVDEVTPPSRTDAQPVPAPAPASAPESEAPPSSGEAMPLVVKPAVQAGVLTAEPEDAQTLPQAMPVHAPPVPLASNQPAPSNAAAVRPAAAPRPAQSPPRPLGNVTGTPLPVRQPVAGTATAPRPTSSVTSTPLPFVTATATATAARPASSATTTPLLQRTGSAGAPPRPASSATATPLPLRAGSATGTPLPRPTAAGSATGTPLPLRAGSATGTPLPRPTATGSATGTPLPTGAQTTNGARAPTTPTPNDTTATPALGEAAGASTSPSDALVTPTPERTTAKAKLVALSPGLLGVTTAMKEAQSAPTSSPDAESAPNSGVPLSVPDAELFDIDSKPPDSAVPIESVDYLESLPPPVAPVEPRPQRHAAAAEPGVLPKPAGKRLPHAPPHPPHPVHPPTPPASDGEELTRKFVRPSDFSRDFLTARAGSEPAPAIAPPDAAALMRAPVSARPPSASSRPEAPATTRAPVSKAGRSGESKSPGLGILFLLVGAAFGGVGYFFMHRMKTPVESSPVAQNAAVAPAPTLEPPAPTLAPPAPPAEPQATATSEATAAPEASAAAVAAATDPAATTTAAPVARASIGEKSSSPHGEKATRETAASTSTTTSETASKSKADAAAIAATATATSTAAIEPRGPVGTEPFDVAAARSALEMSAEQASSCRKPGDPSGVAVVTITFSQTGRVTTANISGPPFQATPTGGCIASTMRRTRVPPFAGDMVTVRKTVTIQ